MRPSLFAALAFAAGLFAAGCAAPPDAARPARAPDADPAAEMRHQHDSDAPTASGATAGADTLDVTAERVGYATVGGRRVTGLLVRPAGVAEPLPGVVVIHEWWGLNENIEAMTRRIAAEGYAALAVDLYGGQTAATPDEAMALMRAATAAPDVATDNLRQAYAFLADAQGAPRVATLGWCFGGAMSLQAALALPTELSAVVVYYGRPVTDPAVLGTLRMPVLGHFGAADSSIPVDTVSAFEQALDVAGVANEIWLYPGADHAFANPSGDSYDPAAAAEAWARTTTFLNEYLRGARESEAAPR